MWAGDEPGSSSCYDACAEVWPPYTLDDAPVAPPGFPGSLGLVDREDGTWQVALDDMPLYYFAGDTSPGDVNGHGNFGFGAPWHIVAFGPPPAAAETYGTPNFGAPGSMPPPPGALQAPPTAPARGPGAQGQFLPPTAQGQMLPPGAYPVLPGQPPAPTYSYGQPGYAQPGYGQPGYAQPGYAQPGPFGPGYATGSFSQTLTIQAPPNGIVGLSWIANPSAASYRIYQTPVSQPLNFTVMQTIQQPTGQLATNALLTGLAPGAAYYVQVRMVSHSGLETVTPASSFSSPNLGR
jgi:hypothetical protein